MADYWKSLPRKFYTFCKCWITDNKPSVEFHERGRKHKDNVQKKIGELRRKGEKFFALKQQQIKMIQKMETAALQAFKKDIENNAPLTFSSGSGIPNKKKDIERNPSLISGKLPVAISRPANQPFGKWVAVKEKEQDYSFLQPKEKMISKGRYQDDDVIFKFEKKCVKKSMFNSNETTFKKRKLNAGTKLNLRSKICN